MSANSQLSEREFALLAAQADGLHRLSWRGRPALIKKRRSAPAGFFAAEYRGLHLLASAQALPTPEVLACDDQFILLNDLGQGRPGSENWLLAGQRLAKQHAQSGPRFGLEEDGWCGDSPQANCPTDDGHRFFAEQRLRPQMQRALAAGRLPVADLGRLDRLISRLSDYLPAAPSVLLHGDLWLGNLHPCSSGELALIDGAAAHYGWAEADLAMLALFGEPPPAFFAAYQEAAVCAADWRERAPLYNLYHLLNHLNLFGSSYLGPLRRALDRYV